MECRDTIIPAAPTPPTALRAFLGALWFQAGHVIRSTLGVLQRSWRQQGNLTRSGAQDDPDSASIEAQAHSDEPTRALAGDTPLGEEKWLRLTEVLPRAG